MEPIAVISDAHANLAALEAVLERIDELGIEHIISLGDTVGYGPEPIECFTLLRKKCDVVLMGNHELSMTDVRVPMNRIARQSADWTHDRLQEAELMDQIGDLPMFHRSDEALFVHGSLRHFLLDYLVEEDKHGFSTFDRVVNTLETDFVDFQLCFVGHNHRPFLATADGFIHPHADRDEFFVEGETIYVSVGSVGQPRDRDPRSCFVTYDGQKVKFHRCAYDIELTAEKVYDTDLPRILGDRLFRGS